MWEKKSKWNHFHIIFNSITFRKIFSNFLLLFYDLSSLEGIYTWRQTNHTHAHTDNNRESSFEKKSPSTLNVIDVWVLIFQSFLLSEKKKKFPFYTKRKYELSSSSSFFQYFAWSENTVVDSFPIDLNKIAFFVIFFLFKEFEEFWFFKKCFADEKRWNKIP